MIIYRQKITVRCSTKYEAVVKEIIEKRVINLEIEQLDESYCGFPVTNFMFYIDINDEYNYEALVDELEQLDFYVYFFV